MAIVRRIEGLTWIVTFGSALLASSCGSSTPASSANGAAGSSASGGELSQAGGAVGGAPDSAAGGKSSVAGSSSGGADNTPLTECPKSAIVILFSPMYSAYDGVHTFQVPAIVDSLDPSVINWSASDDSMVKLETTSGGVMITTRKAGKVSIIASAGSLCGASVLTITDATPDDWMAGSDRYNSGVDITRLPGGMGRPGGGMGGAGGASGTGGAGGATGTDAKCTSCHGDTAATGPYKTVQHTPEQTGGFSDTELINIFENGAFPNGANDVNFDSKILAYAQWQAFHKWDPGGAEKGLVVYLRSLTPAAQTGAANFGRMGGMGGGMGGGGRPGRGGVGGAGGAGGGIGGIGGGTAGAGGTGGSTTSAGSGGTTSGGGTGGA